jgi:hypothetical protein
MAQQTVKEAGDRYVEGPENANEIIILLEASEADDDQIVTEAVKQLSRACEHTLRTEGYAKLREQESLSSKQTCS